ncbi:MAG: hypothetical protein OEV40_20405 [Acidimicrobiia bacterium]|nr:hypothetical protein [Acidimicrobiia bacterium]
MIVTGDEDDWCLDPGGLAELFAMVEAGHWLEKPLAPGTSALLPGLDD